MTETHWIIRTMDAISNPSFWDGVILGFAVGVGLPVIVYLLLFNA